MRFPAALLAAGAWLACASSPMVVEAAPSGKTVVGEEIRVAQGEQLRLPPGTSLLFALGVGITVEGTLTAEGTTAQPIMLAAGKPGERWSGIRVMPGGTVRLVNVSIRDADEALRSAGGTVFLKFCGVSACEKGIIIEMMARAEVEDLTVTDVSQSAFWIRQSSRATLKRCAFSGPGDTGLAVTGSSMATVIDSRFDGFATGLQVATPGMSIEVRNCTFTGCENGVLIEYPECSPRLVNCSFTKNKYGIHAWKLSIPGITGCRVTDNEYGLYIEGGSAAKVAASRIGGNKFGVWVTLSSYPTVNRCDLSGNKNYAVFLDLQSYEWVRSNEGDSGRQQQQMGMRALALGGRGANERTPGAESARVTNPKGSFVDFRQNYWGPEATGEMKSSPELREIGVMYDYFDKEVEIFDGKRYPRDKVDYGDYLSQSPLD